jgi:cardiolipin synthase
MVDHEAKRLSELITSFHMPVPTRGHKITLCSDSCETYKNLVALLNSAKKSIDLATYVFEPDTTGRAVLNLLTQKVHSGLQVRLLVDDIGAHSLKRRHVREFIAAGGQFARFMPLIHINRRADLRNHRKITLVDDLTVMAGGMNIGEEYMGPAPAPNRWKDLSFVLRGPSVGVYSEIFRQDWLFATGKQDSDEEIFPDEQPHFQEDQIAQIVPSGPDVKGDVLYNALVAAIHAADHRVSVITPYFIPDDSMMQALTLAAHRGVDAEVIVPQVSNQRLANLARGPYLRDLAAAGVKVRYYQPGMLHAKAVLVDDDVAMVGSANFDFRSMQLNYEVAMFAYSSDTINAVSKWIDDLRRETLADTKQDIPYLRETVEGVARLLAPLL